MQKAVKGVTGPGLEVCPHKFIPDAIDAQQLSMLGMDNQHIPKRWHDVESVIAFGRLDENVGI